MFRTAVVRDSLGGYDESFPVCQDYELWTRLMRAGFRAQNLREPLLAWRRSTGSVTSTRASEGAAAVESIVARELKASFPDRAFAHEESRIIRTFRSTLSAEDARMFEKLRDDLLSESRTQLTADLRRTVALQHAFLGYNLLLRPPYSRRAAWIEFHRAFAWSPRALRDMPLARTAALFALGGELLTRLRR
jgi:hypothetical protein